MLGMYLVLPQIPPLPSPPLYTTMVILSGDATHVCGRWVCGKECAKWVV